MDNWTISESQFTPIKLNAKETVFTIGNGYLGTRGTFEEGYPGEVASTLLHGVFDDVPIAFTELANTPNWLDLRVTIGGEMFCMDHGKLLFYQRHMDLHTGTLHRKVIWTTISGKKIQLEFERFASLADEHILGLRCQITSIDYSGPVEFRSSLPGHTDNAGWVHWNWKTQGQDNNQNAFLFLETRATKIKLCEAFHLGLINKSPLRQEYWDSHWSPEQILEVHLQPGETATAEKIITVFTSRDTADPKSAALNLLNHARSFGYTALWETNRKAWECEWEMSDITIEGDDESDLALRYSLFQLLIAGPRQDDHVSIAAKTLSGFGYRGHTFWDTEIFILPFFTYTQPQIALNLLKYRFHTLAGAQSKARDQGHEGACFAWESAATGKETTPRWVPLPNGELIRIWCGDIELHITADVVYAIEQYWKITGDDHYIVNYGAEIILDTARYWGSRVEWNEVHQRYEINDVIGPDENHDHVNNDIYTNYMIRWNLKKALEILDWLHQFAPTKAQELKDQLDLSTQRLIHWKDVIENIYINFNSSTRLFEQCDGFFNLKQVDLSLLEPRTQSVQALFGIEDGQKIQIIKQPDVLMMMYLFEENFTQEIVKTNWEYYTPRTDLTFGSSLGPPIQAIMAARVGEIENAYRLFRFAANTDLEDARGNSSDGIHAATNGGLWQACVVGFGGLKITPEGPIATPHLPSKWTRLHFNIQYLNKWYEFDLKSGDLSVEGKINPRQSDPQCQNDQTNQPVFPILGVIFDLDGVLTDTSEFHYLAWKQLADEEGFPFDRKDNEALRGVSRHESLSFLLKGRPCTSDQMQAMMERKNTYYLRYLANLTPANLYPGVVEFLQELRQDNIKIAIGSASKNTQKVIEKLGIGYLIDAISDGYSVVIGKPAPDLFLHAARQLKLPPRQCIVFEDAEVGVKAGLAGHFWVVGVGPIERVGSAHVVIPGLNGLKWEALLDQLRANL
jgi:kojibiose phosphorylase